MNNINWQYSLLLFFSIWSLSISQAAAQTTIWLETFEDNTVNDKTDAGVTPWTLTNGDASEATTFEVENVNTRVAGGDDHWFQCTNTDLGSTAGATWTSGAIDISAYNSNGTGTGVDITLELYEDGNWEGDDVVCIYYTLDGIGTCATTALTDGSFADDNFTNGDNFNFSMAYATAIGAASTATTLRIIVEVDMDDTNDHFYFDNVRVASTGLGFTERANAAGLQVSTATKDGGHAWGDFNNDGCIDVIVNQGTSNGSGNNAVLYQQDKVADVCQGTFTDVTATLVAGMNTRERSVVWADFNNDGFLDFAHNTNNNLDIYYNWGSIGSNFRVINGVPDTEPAYGFGTYVDAANNQEPSFNLNIGNATGNRGIHNTEGMGWADFNKDGWIDLVVDNHNDGTLIFQKIASADATGCATDGFNLLDQDDTGLTRLLTSADGDFLAIGDYDDDGDPDLLIRKRDNTAGQNDIYENIYIDDATTPYYQLNTDFGGTNTSADNNDKGAAVFCDFDNDGDLDAFWTAEDRNQVFEQTAVGVFTPRGSPEHVIDETDVDGCSCGDVDNDGDMDLFLTDNNGPSFLLLNNYDATIPEQNFTFSRFFYNTTPNGIDINADGESNTLVDYDNDGDLDLYVQINNGNNQLWRNDMLNGTEALADRNYLKVRVVVQDPNSEANSTLERNITGAHVTLYDDSYNIVGGIREINGGRGHGSQDPSVVHFGIDDPTISYNLIIKTSEINGVRITDTVSITPNTITSANRTDQVFTAMYPSNLFGIDICNETLPVSLLAFDAVYEKGRVRLNWQTASERNNDYFMVERSDDGILFEPVTRVQGAGDHYSTSDYQAYDDEPFLGTSYYRLRQTDFDGSSTYSKVQIVTINEKASYIFELYPNPSNGSNLHLRSYLNSPLRLQLKVHSLTGQMVHQQVIEGRQGTNDWQLYLPTTLAKGIYLIEIADERGLLLKTSKIYLQ